MATSAINRTVVARVGIWLTISMALLMHAGSAQPGTMTYEYDVHGRLIKQVSADQININYGFDNANNLSSAITFLIDLLAPTVPTNLVASVISYQQINLSWGASTEIGSAGFANYRVFRNGAFVASPVANSLADVGLAGSTVYTYRVSAIDNASNESAQSSPSSATTLPTPDLIPPTVPTGLAGAAVSATWVNLSWSGSTDTGGSGLAGYEIFRNGTLIGTSPSASYADHGTASNTAYGYKVRAYDGAGNRSGDSNTISVTTPDQIAPGVPSLVSLTADTGNQVTVRWSTTLDNAGGAGVQGYKLYRNGAYLTTYLNSSTNPLYVQSYADTTVAANTTYTYTVSAIDAASPPNESAQSSSLQVTTAAAWTPITDDSGNVLATETTWYQMDYTCDSSTGFPVCTFFFRKKYGNLALVWQWSYDYFNPNCPHYSNQGAAGYRQAYPTCRIEANSAAYHQ
jgi:fibronectin type 3 domain-containing protein